jgi:hypothetical protein
LTLALVLGCEPAGGPQSSPGTWLASLGGASARVRVGQQVAQEPAPAPEDAPRVERPSEEARFEAARHEAARGWRYAPGEASARALARAYFPGRTLSGEQAQGSEPHDTLATLRAVLPSSEEGALELSSFGHTFRLQRHAEEGASMRSSPQRFWGAVGELAVEARGTWRTPRVESLAVLPDSAVEYRARYTLTVPEAVTEVRDAAEYLELLDARGVPVLRLHYPVARDAAGRTVRGEAWLSGVARAGALRGGLPSYPLAGRALQVETALSTQSLTAPVAVTEGWSSTGSMAQERIWHTATRLPDGKVLVAGGRGNVGGAWRSAELYEPATGTWSATGSMPRAHANHRATLLPSGKVLVVGGGNENFIMSMGAELYDPATGTWSSLANTHTYRLDHSMTLLPSGKVLVVGNPWSDEPPELYDPATNTWKLLGAMLTPRRDHAAALLPSGKVLIAGGVNGSNTFTASVELFDPATETFSATSSLPQARSFHGQQTHAMAVLPSGRVLLTPSYGTGGALYDTTTGTWSPASASAPSGSIDTLTLLPSGKVLTTAWGDMDSCYLYEPATRLWSLNPCMSVMRQNHTVTLIGPRQVLVTGGFNDDNDMAMLATAEVLTLGNSAPVAHDGTVQVSEDKATGLDLRASDPDGEPLIYTVVTAPARGTLSGTGASLTYRPAANFTGTDSFTFRVNDGTADSNLATVTLTVLPVNDAPRAHSIALSTPEDTPLAVTFPASDVDGDALTYTVLSLPAHGTISGTMPDLTYTPAPNYNGPDSFTFKANDGALDSNVATISFTVTPVNDAPVVQPLEVTIVEDIQASLGVVATDVDGDSLAYVLVAAPTRGSLSGVLPNVLYTPLLNNTTTDTFTLRAYDGTAFSDIATVTLRFLALNDAPVAVSKTVAASEDSPAVVTLTASDVERNTLRYTVVKAPSRGSLSGLPPNLRYIPVPDFHGTDSFTFMVQDSFGAQSNVATMTLTVAPVNDAPVAQPASVWTDRNRPVSLSLETFDVDGNPLAYTLVSLPAHGTISGAPPNYTYTPEGGYSGADSFLFLAHDGALESNVATVNIQVGVIMGPEEEL